MSFRPFTLWGLKNICQQKLVKTTISTFPPQTPRQTSAKAGKAAALEGWWHSHTHSLGCQGSCFCCAALRCQLIPLTWGSRAHLLESNHVRLGISFTAQGCLPSLCSGCFLHPVLRIPALRNSTWAPRPQCCACLSQVRSAHHPLSSSSSVHSGSPRAPICQSCLRC